MDPTVRRGAPTWHGGTPNGGGTDEEFPMSPDDLDQLARTYRDGQRPRQEQDAALARLLDLYCAGHTQDGDGRQALTGQGAQVAAVLTGLLQGPIEEAGRQVAHRAGRWECDGQLAEELRTDALSEILMPRDQTPARICAFRPHEGDLRVWLRTVLANLLRDRLRRRKGRYEQFLPGDERLLPAPIAPILGEGWPESLSSPFSPNDLGQLARWPLLVRVEQLCLSGLSHKVPGELWEEWLAALERSQGRKLLRPFPPESFLTLDQPRDRLRPLARLLSCTANTLAQRRKRHQARLDNLEFIRDLQLATTP
jgi:hypothetical protein